MYKILFVCTGNICRSPIAHGMLRHHIRKMGLESSLLVDSAGTEGFHAGESPDRRAILTARRHNIDISDLTARQIRLKDFEKFDLLLPMDNEHLQQLTRMRPKETVSEIELFLRFAEVPNMLEVPDPYYGEQKDFDQVLELCKRGIPGLMEKLGKRLKS